MRRREFIRLVCGSAAAWPLAARAQQRERMRRIGILSSLAADDPEASRRLTVLAQALQELGWTEGRNVRLDVRWVGERTDRLREYTAELLALAPDVIVTTGSATVSAVLQATHTVPIVFAQVGDPVGGGYVESLARPGGNATGFTSFDYSFSGKYLELLKEIAPRVTQAAVLRDPTLAVAAGQFGVIQSLAQSLGVELRPVDVRDADQLERAVASFARNSNRGLIALGGGGTVIHRALIIQLAAKYRLPAVYPYSYYVVSGGLVSYGPDNIDQYRRAAGYIDRILKGEKPANLPVQSPTKYELVVNLKTAKALGLAIPQSVLTRADEVIE
jgi:putative ABC transport system substrate-binding protein